MSLWNCTHQLGWERGAELVVLAAAQTQYFLLPTPLKLFSQSKMTCSVKPVLPWPTLGQAQRGESETPRTLDLVGGPRVPLTPSVSLICEDTCDA